MPFALLLLTGAACLTWILVEIVRRFSLRWRLFDHPNQRSLHVMPTPRLGGVGMAPVLLGGLALLAARQGGTVPGAVWSVLIVGGMVLVAVSVVDDLRSMPVSLRLAVHLLLGLWVAWSVGARPPVVPEGSVALLPWVTFGVTVVWVAGFINAFNFMDGSDGMAGGHALVAGLGWVLLGTSVGAQPLVHAGALVAGCAVGFLRHNWPPASIFMGDAGSALLGLLLAAVPILLAGMSPWLAALLVWPFVFDTAFTLCRRAARGERLWQAHRTHLYQRLVTTGVSHRTVALLYCALATLGGAAALLVTARAEYLGMTIAGLALAAALLWAAVVRRERRLDATVLPTSA